MYFHPIDKTSDRYFDSVWRLYESAFPTNEKRTKEEQVLTLQKEEYFLLACLDKSAFIGFLGFWEIEGFIFIEHFAIHESLRAQNYGSKVLKLFLEKKEKVFLEIDIPSCTTSIRRLKFYEKLGFVQNEIEHSQVAFRKQDTPLPLAILSWQTPLKKELYKHLYKKMNSLLPII